MVKRSFIKFSFLKSGFSYLFLLLFLSSQASAETSIKAPLIINIFSRNNGKGLEASRQVLKQAIEKHGHVVVEKDRYDTRSYDEPHVDINIFFERINPNWFPCAKFNWFVPNPECFRQDLQDLDGIDLVLCRTHISEEIFKKLNKKTFYLGFTSRDCYKNDVHKDYSSCVHIAGGSPYKGTKAVKKAWKNDAYMPHLWVVMHLKRECLSQENCNWIKQRLPLQKLRTLQNSCGIHLCPSTVEGFGHYIMEALSTEAIVVTTDAPPMNEFVADKRCLVSYERTSQLRLGTNYFVDPDELKSKVKEIISLPLSERKAIGRKNRQVYLQKKRGIL